MSSALFVRLRQHVVTSDRTFMDAVASPQPVERTVTVVHGGHFSIVSASVPSIHAC